jgi:hypothetical protein
MSNTDYVFDSKKYYSNEFSRIKNASSSCDAKSRMAAMINVLADKSYFKPNTSETTRVKIAKQVMKKLLEAQPVQDDPSKSYTQSDVNSNAKNIKLPPASTYETYQQCVSAITAAPYSISSQDASVYCKAVNAPDAPTKSALDISSCVEKLTATGEISASDAKRVCSAIKQPSKSDPSDDTTPSDDMKGGKLYGGSVAYEPAWYRQELADIMGSNISSNLKSAAVQNDSNDDTTSNIVEIMRNRHYGNVGKSKSLKQASESKSDIPAWAAVTMRD